MQPNKIHFRNSESERKAKVEVALVKLQSLKCQISKLRAQCEAIKDLESEKQKGLTCSECCQLIEQEKEVTLKDTSGQVKSHYHRDCFKAIWLSQTWTFDYSSPGFLRSSEKNQ